MLLKIGETPTGLLPLGFPGTGGGGECHGFAGFLKIDPPKWAVSAGPLETPICWISIWLWVKNAYPKWLALLNGSPELVLHTIAAFPLVVARIRFA